MSDYARCPICHEWGWLNSHKCRPLWYVRRDDCDREDESKSFGITPEEAAEKYLSDHFDDFDYPKSLTVKVINQSENEEYTIEIEVEAVPEFSASITNRKPYEPSQDTQP